MSDDEDLTVSDVRAVAGTTRRDSRWHLTDELNVLCLFGRARFDLRQVETTGHDVVEVSVTCALGAVEFVVPDGTVVVLDGTSMLASARSDVSATGDSSLPRIEITATTVLGRVRVVSPERSEGKLAEIDPSPVADSVADSEGGLEAQPEADSEAQPEADSEAQPEADPEAA